jgi:hypothetical protein
VGNVYAAISGNVVAPVALIPISAAAPDHYGRFFAEVGGVAEINKQRRCLSVAFINFVRTGKQTIIPIRYWCRRALLQEFDSVEIYRLPFHLATLHDG